MAQKELPNNIRTILLAYPTKLRRKTKKYVPPVYKPGEVDSGVKRGAISGEPLENWRLEQLAIPKTVTEKYVPPPVDEVIPAVPPSTLTVEATPRVVDLSIPYVNKLVNTREAVKSISEKLVDNINRMIERSWATVYNHYKRQIYKKQKKKKKKLPRGFKRKDSKGKPLSEKEMWERRIKESLQRCALLATPKKVFLPPPKPPRKPADLAAMAARMTSLAEPRFPKKKYIRPSIDPTWVDPTRVSEAAKQYEPSDRMKQLSTNPPHKVRKDKEKVPGVVIRGALFYKPTERVLQLAVPKKKANETDTDLKEDPFFISPNALKYRATARIKELAKPIER